MSPRSRRPSTPPTSLRRRSKGLRFILDDDEGNRIAVALVRQLAELPGTSGTDGDLSTTTLAAAAETERARALAVLVVLERSGYVASRSHEDRGGVTFLWRLTALGRRARGKARRA